MSAPPPRQRDWQPGPARNYHHYDDDPRFYVPRSPPPPLSHDGRPRRHTSERRRPQTPEYYHDYPPVSRRQSKRERPEVVNPPPNSWRPPPGVVTPPYAPSPPIPERFRDRERDRERERELERDREQRQFRDSHESSGSRDHRSRRRDTMPVLSRDPYGQSQPAAGTASYPVVSRDGKFSKNHHLEPEGRPHRRSRQSPPPTHRRPKGNNNTHDMEPSHRRPRAEDYPPAPSLHHPPSHHNGYHGAGAPQQPRSYSRGPPRSSGDIEHGRSSPPLPRSSQSKTQPFYGSSGGTGATKKRTRRSSMPASTKPRGTPWWQNPMVQAGARQAITAGAQAAYRAKDDEGPWFGPRGAKVATAALSAAFIDGIMGQKHSGSARQEVMRTGANLAQDLVEKGELPHRHRHKHKS